MVDGDNIIILWMHTIGHLGSREYQYSINTAILNDVVQPDIRYTNMVDGDNIIILCMHTIGHLGSRGYQYSINIISLLLTPLMGLGQKGRSADMRYEID